MKKPSFIGGVMIIAATIIGAGMLAIPIAGAGIWFYVSACVLCLSALSMMFSGLFILETNLNYKQGASFNTIVKDVLGPGWNILTGLCIVFVLYTLIYAYITTGSTLTFDYLKKLTNTHIELSRITATGLFTLFFALFVWISTKAVDRFSTLLVIVLIISFCLTIFQALPNVDMAVLTLNQPSDFTSLQYWQYLPVLLPVCLASFGFHGNVPSLVKYFQADARKVTYSICFGVLLALIVYFMWLLVVHGNIPRSEFQGIQNAEEDEVLIMLNLLAQSIFDPKHIFKTIIQMFSFFALTSSFLGVALGLFDYFMDFFHLPETRCGRLIACGVTFLPPLLASLLAPFGFTTAISYVGLAAAIWAVIVPALLVKKTRKMRITRTHSYQVIGGNFLIYSVIIFGIVNILSLLLIEFSIIKLF